MKDGARAIGSAGVNADAVQLVVAMSNRLSAMVGTTGRTAEDLDLDNEKDSMTITSSLLQMLQLIGLDWIVGVATCLPEAKKQQHAFFGLRHHPQRYEMASREKIWADVTNQRSCTLSHLDFCVHVTVGWRLIQKF